MKKVLVIGTVVLIALSAHAQLKRITDFGMAKRPELSLSKHKSSLVPSHEIGVFNKDVGFVDGKKAPQRVNPRDVYYNRPAGAFPCGCVGNTAGENLGNFSLLYYYMKPYAEYTFKGEVGEFASFPNLITAWETFADTEEPQMIINEPEYHMCGDWLSAEQFPYFHAILGDSLDDPNAEWYTYPPHSRCPYSSFVAPSLDYLYSENDYVFWWSQKSFVSGGKFADEPYLITYFTGCGKSGINPNENIADTAFVSKASWMGKNSGLWETQDSINWYQTLRVNGFAQVFEKPEHPYLLKHVAANFYKMTLTAPVEINCKVYKLDEVPDYDENACVTLPKAPGELIATGRGTLRPEKIDTTYQSNGLFVIFDLFAQEDNIDYEVAPTVDYPIMIVFEGYNDPEMDNLVDFTAVISSDYHADEGYGETAYLLMEKADENHEFHGDYQWYGLNNFFASSGANISEMKTGFEIYINIDMPFLTNYYLFDDYEYTFPDEGGKMIREIQFEEGETPVEIEGIDFWSWAESANENWIVTWNDSEYLPEWLNIELVDGEEFYYDDGMFAGIEVIAQVTAEPLPANVPYRKATIRFAIPGAYYDYTFKQGVNNNHFIIGDLNGDGVLAIDDVNMLISFVLSLEPLKDTFMRADVDGDGEISVGDVIALIDLILNA